MMYKLGHGSTWAYDDITQRFYEVSHQMSLLDELDSSKSVKSTNVEPKYYIQLIDSIHGYYNLERKTNKEILDTRSESNIYQTMFTENEISKINTNYLLFKTPVEHELKD